MSFFGRIGRWLGKAGKDAGEAAAETAVVGAEVVVAAEAQQEGRGEEVYEERQSWRWQK